MTVPGNDFESPGETEDAFRVRAREWLAANAREVSGASHSRMVDHRMSWEMVQDAKRWQALLYDAGFAGITWPEEWGGAGLFAIHDIAFQDEARAFVHPSHKVFGPSVSMFGPTLMKFGSDLQQTRHLRRMLRGEDVWCQLFSEPDAGSDLASVRTSIRRVGDEFVINGQKVWSSRAQYADLGFLIGRSDPSVPKHHGTSCVVVDMSAPGVEVRPIEQMDGASSFAEVFFTDVRVPVDALVGEWNDGWRVARHTLTNERYTIGSRGRDVGFAGLIELARLNDRESDPHIRRQLVELYVRTQLLRFLGLRLESAARRDASPGPEGSIAKLLYGEVLDASTELALELMGPEGLLARTSDEQVDSDEPYGFWQSQLLGAPSAHIAGGTDQILRTIIGERILGLPREPSPAQTVERS